MVLRIVSVQDEAWDLVRRLVQGRYTIAEAVRAVCNDHEGIDYTILIGELREFVRKGWVAVYEPGIVESNYIPRVICDEYEEIYWNDLNDRWLPSFESIKWRYPLPLGQLRPDWTQWDCQYSTLRDAVCLSANMTPDWVRCIKEVGQKSTLKIFLGYSHRLNSALSWAQNTNCSWRYNNPSEFKETDQVKLAEFARWAIEEKSDWVVPNEFSMLARLSEVPDKPNNRVRRGRPPILSGEEIERLIQMRIESPEISHDSLGSEFGVSRRYVGTLLKKHGIN